MIRILPKPEPTDFDAKVRKPGLAFLASQGISAGMPIPDGFEWKEYWQIAREDLYDDYDEICAYSSIRLHVEQGSVTIDHFHPKSKHPRLAYEWNNFRLASRTMNGRKLAHEDVLDPFQVENGWFVIDFPSGKVMPGRRAEGSISDSVQASISRLQLNETRLKKRRARLLDAYRRGEYSLEFLKSESPFVYAEVIRQGLA